MYTSCFQGCTRRAYIMHSSNAMLVDWCAIESHTVTSICPKYLMTNQPLSVQPSGSEASGKVATTAGFVGAGATAFPVERAGQDLHGEHLSDFDGKVKVTLLVRTRTHNNNAYTRHTHVHA